MKRTFYKDEQKEIYVDENLNVKVDVICGGDIVEVELPRDSIHEVVGNVKLDASREGKLFEVEIPWNVIHEIVGYQKSIPLNQRPDITFCPKCKEPIRKAKYEEHLNLCG